MAGGPGRGGLCGQLRQGALGAHPALNPRRPEEYDRVLNVVVAKSSERLEIFGQDPDGSGIVAFQEFAIQIGKRVCVVHVSNRTRASSRTSGTSAVSGASSFDLEETG